MSCSTSPQISDEKSGAACIKHSDDPPLPYTETQLTPEARVVEAPRDARWGALRLRHPAAHQVDLGAKGERGVADAADVTSISCRYPFFGTPIKTMSSRATSGLPSAPVATIGSVSMIPACARSI